MPLWTGPVVPAVALFLYWEDQTSNLSRYASYPKKYSWFSAAPAHKYG
jgi:hypothetical protein